MVKKTKVKVKPLPQPVEPLPQQVELPLPEVPEEPEEPEESGGANFIYEPEPEPEPVPVKPKKLRPCERIRTPEDIERQRLHTEKRRASRAAYLASLK
mgnify:CR=1 FL=1